MLWNFPCVQAPRLAISDYLFTAPEHLVGQKGVCERGREKERDVYSRAAQAWSRKEENQKTSCSLDGQAGSRAGQGKSELVLLWALSWKPSSKEGENLAVGEVQSCPSSRGKHKAALHCWLMYESLWGT